MKVRLLHVFSDLARVSSSGSLRRTKSNGRILPKDCWIGWDLVVHTHVFLAVWFQRERGKVLLSVAFMWHVLRSMVMSAEEIGMEAELLRTQSEVRVFVAMINLLHDLWLAAAASASGDDSTGVQPCRMKIQGLAFVSCAWQCYFWRHGFVSGDFLQSENLRSMTRWRRRLCTISFLEASLLEMLDFCCCLGLVSVAVTRNWSL
jgi:hypothetical protein